MTQAVDLNLELLPYVARLEREIFVQPWSEQSFRGLIASPDAIARVLLVDGKPAGYYSLYCVCGEGQINNIAVDPEQRGKGYGKELMRDLIEQARLRAIDALTLEVRVSNRRAIGLYESFGFRSVGIRKKFYENTEDALIMWKR